MSHTATGGVTPTSSSPSGPMSVDPICPQPIAAHAAVVSETASLDQGVHKCHHQDFLGLCKQNTVVVGMFMGRRVLLFIYCCTKITVPGVPQKSRDSSLALDRRALVGIPPGNIILLLERSPQICENPQEFAGQCM